jgi:hypothetical protein
MFQPLCYYEDDTSKFDTMETKKDVSRNLGFVARYNLYNQASAKNPVKIRSKLGLEISQCSKWLPPGVPLRLGCIRDSLFSLFISHHDSEFEFRNGTQ